MKFQLNITEMFPIQGNKFKGLYLVNIWVDGPEVKKELVKQQGLYHVL